MSDKQVTKNQHFVPQEYLRGFSEDGITIYEYNLKKGEAIKTPVPIESICREKYLYEIHDKNGEIIRTNFIENTLRNFEGQFAEQRRQLLRKARNRDNYKTKCFLSTEEKQFWVFFAALHIMRNPVTLNGIKEIIQEEMPEPPTDTEAKNLAIAYCLPFFKKAEEGDQNALIVFISILLTKVITVGYAESGHFFTSDHAMYGHRNAVDEPIKFGTLWFPVCSDCAIVFSDSAGVDRSKRNRLIPLKKEELDGINQGIAYIADQMVLSQYPFSKADLNLIEKARKDRAEDKMQERLSENQQK